MSKTGKHDSRRPQRRAQEKPDAGPANTKKAAEKATAATTEDEQPDMGGGSSGGGGASGTW